MDHDMSCDKCKHWNMRYKGENWGFGECTVIGGLIDIDIEGNACIQDIETDYDFFCSGFEAKVND